MISLSITIATDISAALSYMQTTIHNTDKLKWHLSPYTFLIDIVYFKLYYIDIIFDKRMELVHMLPKIRNRYSIENSNSVEVINLWASKLKFQTNPMALIIDNLFLFKKCCTMMLRNGVMNTKYVYINSNHSHYVGLTNNHRITHSRIYSRNTVMV